MKVCRPDQTISALLVQLHLKTLKFTFRRRKLAGLPSYTALLSPRKSSTCLSLHTVVQPVPAILLTPLVSESSVGQIWSFSGRPRASLVRL